MASETVLLTRPYFEFLFPAGTMFNAAADNFDRTATPLIVGLEIVAVVAVVAALFGLRRFKPDILWRFAIVMGAVGCFEVFTMSMWNNFHLGAWAYVYRDVSWILMLGWATFLLGITTLVDHYRKDRPPEWRFPVILILLTLAVLPLDSLLIHLGVRSYTPEVEAVLWGRIPWLEVPWNFLYYVPVFCGLILGFYRYWELALENVPVMPFRKRLWLRDFGIASVAVFLFELMVEPMVENVGFPAWSYIYRDISILQTFGWVLLIGTGLKVVDTLFAHFRVAGRFFMYVTLLTLVAVPIEAWLMAKGMRVYSQSAVMNFSGLRVPWCHAPIEVVGGFSLYFSLVVCFTRYWEVILDRRRLADV